MEDCKKVIRDNKEQGLTLQGSPDCKVRPCS